MNNKAFFFAATLFLPLAILAADMPSISAGRDALSATWARGDKCVRVSHFEKTEGQSSEVSGIRYYAMDYQAHLTFTTPCYAEYDAERKRFSWPPRLTRDFLTQKNRLFQTGDTVIVQGKLHFEKKESGWHHQSGHRTENGTEVGKEKKSDPKNSHDELLGPPPKTRL